MRENHMKMKVLHLIFSCFICIPTQQYYELTDFFPPTLFTFIRVTITTPVGSRYLGPLETQTPSLMNPTSAFSQF